MTAAALDALLVIGLLVVVFLTMLRWP